MKVLTPTLVLATALSMAAALSLPTNAAADDGKPAATSPTSPQAALVAVMVDTGQAMLWDSNRGEYVVVKVGDTFQGFTVAELSKDQIVLRKGELHYVLPRTADTKNLGNKKTKGKKGKHKADKTDKADKSAELLNPYPEDAPLDPYAEDANIRVVIAPDGVGVEPGPQAPFSPPSATTPSTPAPGPATEPAKPAKQPKVETVPPTVVAPDAPPSELREESYTISRAELDSVMDDFNKLGKEVQADIGKKGIYLKSVARGSFIHRLGLRDGDLVLKVDGKPVTSLDAAAGVYAHLLDASKFTIKVKRGDNLITLRYQLAK